MKVNAIQFIALIVGCACVINALSFWLWPATKGFFAVPEATRGVFAIGATLIMIVVITRWASS